MFKSLVGWAKKKIAAVLLSRAMEQALAQAAKKAAEKRQ